MYNISPNLVDMFYSDVWVDRGRDGEKLLHQEDSMVADDPVNILGKIER